MRLAVRLLALVALAPAFVIGSSAFSSEETSARSVSVKLVGDTTAYLTIEPYSSDHGCFVNKEDPSGMVSIHFGYVDTGCNTASGGGLGINPGDAAGRYSRYAFHDILRLTNKAPQSVNVWVNASMEGGSEGGSAVMVARSTTASSMTVASYYTTKLEPVTLATGGMMYIGLLVNSGALVMNDQLRGTILVTALGA